MVPRTQTSSEGVLALLNEQEPLLQQYALKQLNTLVPQFWAEISESVSLIEALFESNELPKDARDLAALVSSKVYYYLGEYDEALSFALGAGKAFEGERSNEGSEEYVETILSKAIDRYIDLRVLEESGASQSKIDPRLAAIIEGIFNKCIEDGEHKQVRLVSFNILILRNTPSTPYSHTGFGHCSGKFKARHYHPSLSAHKRHGYPIIHNGGRT